MTPMSRSDSDRGIHLESGVARVARGKVRVVRRAKRLGKQGNAHLSPTAGGREPEPPRPPSWHSKASCTSAPQTANGDLSVPSLIHFAPGERPEVRAINECRLVLCFAPWLGSGHPSRTPHRRIGPTDTSQDTSPARRCLPYDRLGVGKEP